jgi:polyphosphate kinase
VIPVTDPNCRAELIDVLDRSLTDDTNSWDLGSDGRWTRRETGEPPHSMQRALIERAQARASADPASL